MPDELIIKDHNTVLSEISEIKEKLTHIEDVVLFGNYLDFHDNEVTNWLVNKSLDAGIINHNQLMAILELWKKERGNR